MKKAAYQRFAISIPEGMAAQIEIACKSEGRNRSEFFREVVRDYMGTDNGERSPSYAKDLKLAKWAAIVESDPVFADVRAVSSDVNAIAGEAVV
jgi:hypothetical protein